MTALEFLLGSLAEAFRIFASLPAAVWVVLAILAFCGGLAGIASASEEERKKERREAAIDALLADEAAKRRSES